MTPTGRSYLVHAPERGLAPCLARIEARKQGHPNAAKTRTLHVERIERGLYEVVLMDGQIR
jgi:hypothetical protein